MDFESESEGFYGFCEKDFDSDIELDFEQGLVLTVRVTVMGWLSDYENAHIDI